MTKFASPQRPLFRARALANLGESWQILKNSWQKKRNIHVISAAKQLEIINRSRLVREYIN